MTAPLAFLVQAPLLQSLTKPQIKAIAGICQRHELDPQERVVQRGAVGAGAFFIEKGILEVVLEKDGVRDVVGTLTGPEYKDDARGDVFGDICLVEPKPWNASFYTVEHTVLWLLPFEKLSELYASDPDLKGRLAGNVAIRLHRRLTARGQA